MSLGDNPFARAPGKHSTPAVLGNQEAWSFGGGVRATTNSKGWYNSFQGVEEAAPSSPPVQVASVFSGGFEAPTSDVQGRFSSLGDVKPTFSNTTSPATHAVVTASNAVPSYSSKELTYQQLLIRQHFDGSSHSLDQDKLNETAQFHTPSLLLPNDIQKLRLFLPADFDMIPFTWIDSLLSSTKTTFTSLGSVQICFQSLVRPFLTDLNDELENSEVFTSMLSAFKNSSISLEILFRTVKAQNQGDNGLEMQNFRKVDLDMLTTAIYELAYQEHTDPVTEVLAEESRLKDIPVRPTEGGCGYCMRIHAVSMGDDEWL